MCHSCYGIGGACGVCRSRGGCFTVVFVSCRRLWCGGLHYPSAWSLSWSLILLLYVRWGVLIVVVVVVVEDLVLSLLSGSSFELEWSGWIMIEIILMSLCRTYYRYLGRHSDWGDHGGRGLK